ncbi:MAG: Peptidase S9 prolyl oligopeptidase active site domain protein [Candidatus Nomurabacteria bacterium GW2011_GWF2_35_66]|uniref:Peptidase S9 prolyl oligopeptidase active site domain protein n=1 Tax=Candidatus Nomurabacteria bacterium GW2011_GWE1_35_16 TaxID=1618761 RepID=A0A0G0BBL0_9BACT|nr:MAG: Peptidase S9 prolyl oligopeptidase active site domain protein [Candidatus Nomurabacteria bacterium GW2011_GWF1_34_20]KKP63671.1 MAG: Peptidase S9 prolyl oligopeptidase active site domain protein [Candidatus Nomurabacteria bacterium GW2011_GWE2_34_25]KKP66873.1 MAG: Peptidase S9 prolyl oligopeptidase active site domain protein [Candidatus Nomurabacteria bacterium GW2011_GWE1_35_16]KKP83499.1 MAG: Peptidase S9 prolyl oligopeptidase active site domain protein [Candidatus Nomurabacteria bact
MTKFKYLILLSIFFISFLKVEALDIQYGSILGNKGNNVLIQYYGIEKKNNYICNVLSFKCITTKKTNLGATIPTTFKASIKKELKEKEASHATLSRSNKWLAYYISAEEPDNVRTYVIKDIKKDVNYIVSSGVSYWDLVDEQKTVFLFSPDEKTLIYTDDKDDTMSLYKVDMSTLTNTTFENTKISVTAWNIATFMFYDSQTIYYVGNSKENPYKWSLYKLNLKTGIDEIIETDVSYVDSIKKIGSSLVFISLQEKGYGPEIYNPKTKKLSYLKVPNISTKKIIKNEEYIKVGNGTGIIMTPPNYDANKTYPVLIWLHGGPLRQTSMGYHPYHSYGLYDAMLKLLQKNDVLVLKLDYRGSFGFGRAYSESIKGSVGLGDIEDVMEAVQYVKNKYHISNIYLSGNSYGGYMSLRAVVEHPETFKGVFSINGVTDWEALMVKMKTSIFNTQFYGLPNEENRKLYDQASIINKISNLGNQRIEIIQGEADRTIPLWQATLLYDKLKEAKKNVNLVTYPREDHVFKYKKNIGDICVRMFGLIGIEPDKECNN